MKKPEETRKLLPTPATRMELPEVGFFFRSRRNVVAKWAAKWEK